MKYNCNLTRDCIHEYKRICNYYENCNKCPLYNKKYERCYEIETETEIVIDKLQKWSDEHPENTNSFEYRFCD